MEHSTARTNLALSKRRLIAAVGLLMLMAGMMAAHHRAQTDSLTVRVERVIDGDTIQFEHDGRTHIVRLVGVDTPETVRTEPVQRFGAQAHLVPIRRWRTQVGAPCPPDHGRLAPS